MNYINILCATAALGCVAAAAIADVRHFEIPDSWSIAVVILFGACSIGLPLAQLWPHVLAGAAVFAFGTGLFACGWLGGGDVKLLAACAVWSGFGGLPLLLGGTALTGGVLAGFIVALRKVAGPNRSYPALRTDGPLPYAVAILGGATIFASLSV